MSRLTAVYHVQADGTAAIAARARAIAVEQSVEMPVEAIDEAYVLAEIVGRVEAIEALSAGVYEVRIGLATATVMDSRGACDFGQLANMLFGNTSLHTDVVLHDVELPAEVLSTAGPRHGVPGLRGRVAARHRALTCSALKPQGMPPAALAGLAERFARGGVDYLKDDHGLADQHYSPFAERVGACAAAVRRANAATGNATQYVPSLSGSLDRLRAQVALCRDEGVGVVMVAPMIAGPSNIQALVRDNPDIAFMAHPTLGGAARIAPELLIGKLFPLMGADAVVFPTFGGRFGYSAETCRDLARNAIAPPSPLLPALPVPAGGMTLARVAEKLDFYGPDTMLLIGGNLLLARDRLVEETAAFVRAVANHVYG
jgi:ribulose-bisphosphate carboxylase large chain